MGRRSLQGFVGVLVCGTLQLTLLGLLYQSMQEDASTEDEPTDWELALARVGGPVA